MAHTPITLTALSNSSTNVTISAYNDGIVIFSAFTINTKKPIKDACKRILKLVGKIAQPYPVNVYRGSKLLYQVKSVLWGTRQTLDETLTDDEVVYQRSLTRE